MSEKGLDWTRKEDEQRYTEIVHMIINILQQEARSNPHFQQAAIINVLSQVTAWILAGSYTQQKDIDACLYGMEGAIEVYIPRWRNILEKAGKKP